MRVEDFFSIDNDRIRFTPEQGSRFAKEIADDFNPLHNPDNKLFCVPGDLLFSVALHRYGLSQKMRFEFAGMVTGEKPIIYPESDAQQIDVVDEEGRKYLGIARSGKHTDDRDMIARLSRAYVEFSGHSFPHILVPLMAEQKVMINPKRPMIIYQSMGISLDRVDISNPSLEFTGAKIEVNGKKGNICLEFCFRDGDEVIGKGGKYMALRGLQEYSPEAETELVATYNRYKQDYTVP